MSRLVDRFAIGAIVGDVETDNDAVRLRQSGAPAYQVQTHDICATSNRFILRRRSLLRRRSSGSETLDLLIIENVGNLVALPPSTWAKTCKSSWCRPPKEKTSR